jgi:hypothetical protein
LPSSEDQGRDRLHCAVAKTKGQARVEPCDAGLPLCA